MKIDGQCHCGNISYEAETDPDRVLVCHCTDCQTLTGSAYRVTVLTSHDSVHLTGEAPKVYVKTGDNGRKRRQYFCPERGSPLFTAGEGAEAEDWGHPPGQHSQTPGACAEAADLVPLRRSLA